MGRSGRPDVGYRLADHVRYVDALVEAVAPDGVTLVGHDWGGVIALDHARRFPGRGCFTLIWMGFLIRGDYAVWD